MDVLTFGLSATLAQVLTNLDNLALMMAMMVAVGARRAIGGYLVAQTVILVLALAVAEGLESGLPDRVGYLGLIPLGLGVLGLWRQWRRQEDEAPVKAIERGGLVAAVALYLSISVDSFSVMVPLLADSVGAYRWTALAGGGLGALLLAGVGMSVTRLAPTSLDRISRLERLAPLVMIAVGFYVLLNTGTDAL
ncbi:hypothetical protein ACS3QZ_03560 [Shimia sp. W99]